MRMNSRSWSTMLAVLLLATAVTPADAKDRWRHMALAATHAATRGGIVVCAVPWPRGSSENTAEVACRAPTHGHSTAVTIASHALRAQADFFPPRDAVSLPAGTKT